MNAINTQNNVQLKDDTQSRGGGSAHSLDMPRGHTVLAPGHTVKLREWKH